MDPSSTRRLLTWAVAPAIPAWIVLFGLAAFGLTPWWAALTAAIVLFVILGVLVLARLGDFDRLIRFAEDLADNPDAHPPELARSDTANRLLAALMALRRLWAARRDEVAALARARADILDSLPHPLILVDARRRIVSANTAARDLFEIERSGASLAGRDLASVIRDPRVLEAADQALGAGRHGAVEFTLLSPVEHTFRAQIVPFAGVHVDGTALIVTLADETERLKTDRMRADFVANASHELRTPLASVVGFIETLKGPARDDTKARDEFLDIMLKQANRMTRLIEDLLSLSRIELREHTRPTEAVDVEQMLKNTAELLDRQAKERGSAIVISQTTVPPVVGDANELGQVFHNLLTNALKYGGDRGRVDVTVGMSQGRPPSMPGRGPCVTIAVRDHGEGIAREHLPRLTERFYRVDTARSRQLGGTGLGLAIVKHIINRHRGALIVDSEIGKGSTFTVCLPPATGAQMPARAAS